ncbi:MAG TPA: sigma 54-interacting transcriptional regulator [Kofleriaceae bacterium]|nr:sigma 54-interacting transcriptional regulator [Kofleriaceae bacterium]
MGDDRTTTAALAVFDDGERPNSWYLIAQLGGEVRSRVIPLDDGAEIVFGRTANSDVAIDHEAVSRRHAVVRRRGEVVVVEDLDSRNGTLVNGAPIKAPRRVTAGDVVTVGPAIAVVASTSAARNERHVATVNELDDRLDAEVDRAVRYHRPLAVAMLRFEGPVDPITAHIEAVATRLRRMDLIAEYGTDEVALVLPETDRTAAETVARRAAEAGGGITVHLGIATFPEDGSHAGELIGVARERLRGARAPRIDGASPTTLPALGREIVVADPLMKQVFELAKRVAGSPITVLVVGETGVGKEVVAEAVHRLSPRVAGPYVRLNCASLSESLVEAELFGHEKGAFTGAVGTKQGFFEVAAGGTLFLDEVGELSLRTQAKLLRVLEQRRIVRVGGTKEIPIDVRLVCATNRELDVEVRRGRFREDLYFRISAFVIPVPPLRDRRSEIPLLAAQFARELSAELGDHVATLSPEAIAVLSAYDWPGNVRELRNVIERAVVLSGRSRIEPQHFADRLRERAVPSRGAEHGPLDVRGRVAKVERDVVVAALDANQGNQTQAAKQLGISRFALIRLMEKHDLKPRPPRG